MLRHVPLLALALASGLAAQNCFYMPSNTPNSGTCNVIPWGVNTASRTWSNQRYQAKFTKAELGNAKRIIKDLAFAPCGSGTHRSTSLVIRMAHHNGALTTNFATNLGSSSVVVLNKTNHTWTKTVNAWSNVGLTNTFAYDPAKGDLLIDITVTGNINTGGTGMHRQSGRQRLYAFGWTGSPPATGRIDTAALKMRVCTSGGAFGNVGQGCGPGPLTMQGTGVPNIGQTIGIRAIKGRPNSGGAIVLGGQRQAIKLDLIGMTGCVLYTDVLAVQGTAFNSSGISVPWSLALPNDPTLVNQSFFSTAANFDPSANSFGIATADRLEVTIGK